MALWSIAAIVAIGTASEAYLWWTRPRPVGPTQIFRGVTYACLEVNTPECRGLVHVVKVDLSAPGVQIYLTPVDPEAVAEGWQYRLDTAPSVIERERLAVVVNATFFSSDSGWIRWSGDLARGVQTIVADGQVSHVDPHSYLLWFESDLTPHLEFEKPPSDAVLREARWGVGGGGVAVWKGAVREGVASHEMDRRTAVGIDTGRRLLWLAVFENASPAAVARFLAEQGSQDGFLLDGGHSTTLVLDQKAAHVQSGALIRGGRPVATFFGVRAEAKEGER